MTTYKLFLGGSHRRHRAGSTMDIPSRLRSSVRNGAIRKMPEQEKTTPVLQDMQGIPVAGHDGMLLDRWGAHAPWSTRNIVILKDRAGRTGLGEVPGGEGIRRVLEHSRALVIGQPLGATTA